MYIHLQGVFVYSVTICYNDTRVSMVELGDFGVVVYRHIYLTLIKGYNIYDRKEPCYEWTSARNRQRVEKCELNIGKL